MCIRDRNNLKRDSGKYIGNILSEDRTLNSFLISDNKIGTEGVAYLCSALKNNKSVAFFGLCNHFCANIDKNGIEIEGAKHVGELLLKNSSITSLAFCTIAKSR
eukprot:TRINITY_DN14888_c0_g1_i1.p2 TRINITY_DN14888_c0_g1~~TRINITY_DN14888_c0_g1_i1.p2  ORF type:complete len:104 (+),score=5.54 TRINITY_DN14888_c0_g1_i1:65-376(+)